MLRVLLNLVFLFHPWKILALTSRRWVCKALVFIAISSKSSQRQNWTPTCMATWNRGLHDDIIKWKHFPLYWPFVHGIHQSPVNSLTKAGDADLRCFLWSVPEQTLNKQPRCLWVETPSCSLRSHYDVFGVIEITLDDPTAVPHQLKKWTVPIKDNDMAVIDLRSAQVYCVAIFLVSQEVSLNFHRCCG